MIFDIFWDLNLVQSKIKNDQVKNGFLATQNFQPLLGLQYLDIFFFWTDEKEKL